MFARKIAKADSRQRTTVGLITSDTAFTDRVGAALAATQRFDVTTIHGRLADVAVKAAASPRAMLVIDFVAEDPEEFAALERLTLHTAGSTTIVVLADSLSEAATRRLLRAKVADWLPRTSSDADIVLALEQAQRPVSEAANTQATCMAFIAAIGGAGATTLALAAASVLAGKAKQALDKACIVDLDFQLGAVADHLDLTPNLELSEIAASPERLDAQLLEVLLSRHSTGLSMLASPPHVDPIGPADPNTVGRLLELVAARFDHMVVDLPRGLLTWSEVVARGADKMFVVTELSVSGLRQARRTTDMLAKLYGLDVSASVIVNKCPRFGVGGLKRSHATEMLGDRLAGFVNDYSGLVRDAQNRGLLLSQSKASNGVESELRAILSSHVKSK